jgi:indole-3-glycerol phosphate synthase
MILDEIAAKTRIRIESLKNSIPEELIRKEAYEIAAREKKSQNIAFPFEKALQKEGISFICEVKKASPSKGVIAESFPYMEIAKDYEQAGAAALSVLTEPYYFKGSDSYLKEIARSVNIPVLRKDFTVDAYMLYEAKVMGASAVLLICAILSDEELKRYMEITKELGMSALVEAHTEEEVRRSLKCGANIIGVNNRDLKTFQVNIHTSEQLRCIVPENILYVSESGIKTTEDIQRLRKNKTDAVLIGETLMRSENKKKMLEQLAGY